MSCARMPDVPGPEPLSAAALSDRSALDFGAGNADAGLYLAATSRGAEIVLTPAVAAEFGGEALPPDWYMEPWKEGGRIERSERAIALEAATVGLHALY